MKKKTKNIAASFLGNISEWYEFVVYAFCAPFLGPLFFPADSKFVSVLSVFAAFAVGFFMRPLGSVIFGYFGDKYGRQKTVSIAVILIGLPTVIMGLMPTYATIGVAAPIILVLVRILQGISVGGQYTGSAVFISEHIGCEYRHFGSGLTVTGGLVGMLIASAVGSILTAVLTPLELAQWGWRIPFLLGILVTAIGYYLKTCTEETPEFLNLIQRGENSQNPLRDCFKTQKTNMLISFLVFWLTSILVYQLFIFMPTFASRYLDIPLAETLSINSLAMVVLAACSLLFGYIADKFHYKHVMLSAAILLAIFGYPLYWFMISEQSALSLLISQVVFAIIGAAYLGPGMGVLTHLFPIKIRYTAFSISHNLSFGIFGGSVALINIYLIETYDWLIFPALYLGVAAVFSILALLAIDYKKI